MPALRLIVDEPPALDADGTTFPMTAPLRQLDGRLRPSRKVRRPMDGLTEWHISDGLFAIVGSRLETFTVNWRQFDMYDHEELYPETRNIATDAGFCLDNDHDDLLAMHGTPTQTRLDIDYQLQSQRMVTEYELFDGDGDFFYFRASFRNDLVTGVQFARKSVFDL